MTHFTIKPFEPTDEMYESIVHIENTVWQDEKTTVENFKHNDANRKGKFWQRTVCEVDGRIVAFGIHAHAWWSERKGKYFLNYMVLPEYRNRGIGSALFQNGLDNLLQRDDIEILMTSTREDVPAGIHFIKKRGFVQVMRYPRSHIDVQAFEASKFQSLIDKLASEDIEFFDVNQLAERYPDYQERIHRLETEIDRDIPSPDPIKETPFEEYRKQLFESPDYYPESWRIAVDNDKFVGLSALWKTPEEGKLSTGLTGVLRTHRRRGLATALKAQVLDFAKGLGVKDIDTDNEENNPMYQLNLQLGFEPLPAYLDFQKEIVPQVESESKDEPSK